MENFTKEEKFEVQELMTSTSARASNIQPESPVGQTNTAPSVKTEGRRYIIVVQVIYAQLRYFKSVRL